MKALLILLLVPAQAFAGAAINCPSEYSPKNLTAKAPSEWKGIAYAPGSRLILTGAGVLVGDPTGEAQGTQIPDGPIKTPKGLKYNFPNLNGFVEHLEKWVYCSYGLGGDIQLIRRVADNTDSCEMNVVGGKKDIHGIGITCR